MGSDPKTEAGRRLLGKLDYMGTHSQDSSFPFAYDDIRAIEEEAARLVSPADREGLPDEAAVNEWPGGGARVSSLGSSYPEDANRWIADPDGAWVVLYAPRSQYDGLRRLGLAVQQEPDGTTAPAQPINLSLGAIRVDYPLAGQREDAPLDAAWREAEAALPEGMSLMRLDYLPVHREKYGEEPCRAHAEWWSGHDLNRADAEGPTPAAALQALAARLRESKP